MTKADRTVRRTLWFIVEYVMYFNLCVISIRINRQPSASVTGAPRSNLRGVRQRNTIMSSDTGGTPPSVAAPANVNIQVDAFSASSLGMVPVRGSQSGSTNTSGHAPLSGIPFAGSGRTTPFSHVHGTPSAGSTPSSPRSSRLAAFLAQSDAKAAAGRPASASLPISRPAADKTSGAGRSVNASVVSHDEDLPSFSPDAVAALADLSANAARRVQFDPAGVQVTPVARDPRFTGVRPQAPKLGRLLPHADARLEYCLRSAFTTALGCLWVFHPATEDMLPGSLLVAAIGILLASNTVGATIMTGRWLFVAALTSWPLCVAIVEVLSPDNRVAVGILLFIVVALHNYLAAHPVQFKIAAAYTIVTTMVYVHVGVLAGCGAGHLTNRASAGLCRVTVWTRGG